MHYSFNWYKELYSLDDIAYINKRIQALPIDKFSSDDPSSDSVKSCHVKVIRKSMLPSLLDDFFIFVRQSNRNFYGFDLFDSYAGETVNYNSYFSGQEYSWHTDGQTDMAQDIKLTAILNLSENYEGGDLELFLNGPKVIEEFRTPGSAIIFPSFIPHRVTPVTKGCRITLSYWCQGPNWK